VRVVGRSFEVAEEKEETVVEEEEEEEEEEAPAPGRVPPQTLRL
jgi:hypothetical protein